MKIPSFLKKGIFYFLLVFITGCSALMTSIGNSKVDDAINIYSTRGLTSDGTLQLISGLEYYPESQIGINQYRKQYLEITQLKNTIIKKKNFNQQDLNALNLYLLTIEEFRKIQPKIPTIAIDYNDFNRSKFEIIKIFENFISKDEKLNISRNQKIDNINFYKKLNKYINSYLINNIILNLQNDVTINLYITSSFRGFSGLDSLVTNSLMQASDMNPNRDLGNYIIFKGYNDFISPNFNNYFIDFNFSNVYIRVIETKEETKDNHKIFIVKKRITVSGYYKVYSQNTIPAIKYFEFSENYTLKTETNNSTTFYDDERDIVKTILKNKFSNIIHYDLENLITIY